VIRASIGAPRSPLQGRRGKVREIVESDRAEWARLREALWLCVREATRAVSKRTLAQRCSISNCRESTDERHPQGRLLLAWFMRPTSTISTPASSYVSKSATGLRRAHVRSGPQPFHARSRHVSALRFVVLGFCVVLVSASAAYAVSPSPVPVPEPGTGLLLVSGVSAGWAVLRRRRQK